MLERLERLRTTLAEAGATVAIRGAGSARFVLAEHQGRAIEASLKSDAWWIEFWETDNDANAPPVGEQNVADDAEAIQVAIAWLIAKTAS